MKYDKNDKYRQWILILYPESMVDNWKDIIDDSLQVPFCYIIHDKDNFKLEENEPERKIHIHLWIVWNNTVWLGALLKIINKYLAKPFIDDNGNILPGRCCSTGEPVFNTERAWLYLVHKDPKSLERDYKFKYDDDLRICCNNFDIGSLLDLSKREIQDIKSTITHSIIDNKITDLATLFLFVESNYDEFFMYVFQNYNSYFDKICIGIWKKYKKKDED